MHYQKRSTQAEVVAGALKHVTYDFGLQFLSTFHAAFSFTLGLLTHELVKELAAQQWSNQKFFSWLIFMMIAFIFPKLRELYEGGCGTASVEDTATVKPTGNSGHSSYYIT